MPCYNKQLINLNCFCMTELGNINWPLVSFVQTSLHWVHTATTSGQYSPVQPSRLVRKRLIKTIFFCVNRVWGTNGEGQYAGDEASEWFSNYLNRPNCTLYKLSKPRAIDMEEKRSLAMPDDKVCRYNNIISPTVYKPRDWPIK